MNLSLKTFRVTERHCQSRAKAPTVALAALLTFSLVPHPVYAQSAPSPITSTGTSAAPVATAPASPAPTSSGPTTTAPATTSPATTASPVVPQATSPQTPAAPSASPVNPSAAQPTAQEQTPAPQATPPQTSPATELAPATEANPVLPHELTPLGMFMAADYIVKAVMIGLAFASVVTWSVWLAKTLELLGARRKLMRDLRRVESARSLEDASDKLQNANGDIATLTNAALDELNRSRDAMIHEGVKERVASLFSRLEAAASRRMTRGTSILATIGSTAPFVGLFGTVWGIMNAFIGISKSQTTNLAVVAPGIAEALLATAMGLVAAIPAVMIYNMFARAIASYRGLLGDGSAELMRMVSRDLNRAELTPHRRAAE
ncbi:MAG: tonB-system energizer ExbB [Rhizobiales bacterium]|nr:tonB-system energizer ExbB [Hyphomicrobiales bacterium]